MKWAMGRGLRETDPTAGAVAAMPKHRAKVAHRRALHHRDLSNALDRVRHRGQHQHVGWGWRCWR